MLNLSGNLQISEQDYMPSAAVTRKEATMVLQVTITKTGDKKGTKIAHCHIRKHEIRPLRVRERERESFISIQKIVVY